jgi:hypothetical protein
VASGWWLVAVSPRPPPLATTHYPLPTTHYPLPTSHYHGHPRSRNRRAPLEDPRAATRRPARRHHAALGRFVSRRLGSRVVLGSALHERLYLVGSRRRTRRRVGRPGVPDAACRCVHDAEGELSVLWNRGSNQRPGTGDRSTAQCDREGVRGCVCLRRLGRAVNRPANRRT